jgi:nucleotide-binding universal stress UspA family protein
METPAAETHHGSAPDPPIVARIAAGIDGFPEGEDAAALAAALAEATGADLMFVAVHSDPLITPPVGMSWSSLRKEAQAALHRARATHAPKARTVVETDFSVPRALHRVIRRARSDLLVLGSSRKAPEGRVLIGKRARQLLCHFECPLAVAPRGFRERAKAGFSRIGVGYDGGAESQAALELAASIALGAGADLEVDAVVDDRMPLLGWSRFSHGGAEHPRWEDAVLAEVERRRVDTEAAAEANGASGKVEIKRGRPANALLDLSQEVDLLVIGSRRWGPMSRLLLGSTGEALMHDAACPVMVVPRPTT